MTDIDGLDAHLLQLFRTGSEKQRRAMTMAAEAFMNGETIEEAMVILLTEQGWPTAHARTEVARVMSVPPPPDGWWLERLN
jgi:hypothetical protein